MGQNSAFQSFFLLILLLVCINEVQAQRIFFNVVKYGARADGKTDNSKAIFAAWNNACQTKSGYSVVLIPPGKFMVGPMVLKGPCKGPIGFHVRGVLQAPTDISSRHLDHWITFQYIDRLTINGGGSFDGQGASAWPYNTCSKDPHCKPLPVSIRLDFVTNSRVGNIKLINSKNFHMNMFECRNVTVKRVKITAPGDSPNTDGIHIAVSSNIKILDSDISTGDDCISMGPGLYNVNITNINCGPGHGISIGSLGGTANEGDVNGITVTNCNLTDTTNGVRIKTWASSYSSTVSGLTFHNINCINVANPIIIDQQYCPSRNCNDQATSQVQIRDVQFRHIWGTSSTKLAVNLQCSKSRPCQNVELKNINIVNHGVDRGDATSLCSNVRGVAYGKQHPPSCL